MPPVTQRRLFQVLPMAVFALLSYGLASLFALGSYAATSELTIVLMVFSFAAYFTGVMMARNTGANSPSGGTPDDS